MPVARVTFLIVARLVKGYFSGKASGYTMNGRIFGTETIDFNIVPLPRSTRSLSPPQPWVTCVASGTQSLGAGPCTARRPKVNSGAHPWRSARKKTSDLVRRASRQRLGPRVGDQ